jgi:DNA-binding NtrC family response regulator
MSDPVFEIFVVDDEQVALDGMAMALRKYYRVSKFTSAEPALEAMGQAHPHLVLLDIGLPGLSGLEALERIKAESPETVVIMITAYEDVQTVVTAMKNGAHDYLVKPLHMDGLLVTVAHALENLSLKNEIHALHEKYLTEDSPCFIGASNAMLGVMDIVNKVAKSPDTPIHIAGETGTGKELIAQAIYYRSPNMKGPLVTVNCAAIPKDLIESELFGYEKGAFSGADAAGKTGLVEKAHQGALFLDEVADLSLEAQAKILRFLESGEFYRVGSTKKRSIRTRVISATNRNLEKQIEVGAFRQDLYYRLAVVKIEAPSLNERPDDILPIAEHYIKLFCAKLGRNPAELSEEAQTALPRHRWKGNVRELRNMVERAVIVAEGRTIRPGDLGLGLQPATVWAGDQASINLPLFTGAGVDLPGILAGIEKYYLDQALTAAGHKESAAARLLGLSRDTFRYRRKQYE